MATSIRLTPEIEKRLDHLVDKQAAPKRFICVKLSRKGLTIWKITTWRRLVAGRYTEFRDALLSEGVECLLSGDVGTGVANTQV